MINKNDISGKFGTDIFCDPDIPLWAALYDGTPPYLYADGITDTLNLPYSAARETARLAVLEFRSVSENNDPVFDWQAVVDDAPLYTEYACALGGVMLKPYFDGKKIITNYIRADSFYPTAFDNNHNIVGCIFAEQFFARKKYFTRLEYHRYEGEKYLISNRGFISDSSASIGNEVSLVSVPEWENISAETALENISAPLFAYFSVNGGKSVFARAVSIFRNADEQYSRLLWEAKATEPAVFADVTVLRPKDKKKQSGLSRMSDRLFKLLDLADDSMIKEYAPAIRDVSQINILNTVLRRAEFLCGLAYGTFSDISKVEKTASEIKASKQRSYAAVVSVQHELKKALMKYLSAVSELYSLYDLGEFIPEASFEFDDSLVTDAETEQKLLLQEVSAGLISPAFYLQRRYGVTPEQAAEIYCRVPPDADIVKRSY